MNGQLWCPQLRFDWFPTVSHSLSNHDSSTICDKREDAVISNRGNTDLWQYL